MEKLIKIRPLFKNYTYTSRRGLAKGLKRKGGLGFIPGASVLSKEDAFLHNLDLQGKTIYDIGAFEGIFTLFFARSVGDRGNVVTFEANPINYKTILDNLKLNQFEQVNVINIALGNEPGKLNLVFRTSEAGSGSLDIEVQRMLPQTSSIQRIEVNIDTLDRQVKLHDLPLPDFIKIDVEGFEAKVLQGMQEVLKEVKPDLFIELHGFLMPDTAQLYWEEIISNLFDLRYSIQHIETLESIYLDMPQPPLSGHLYARQE